MQYLHCIAHWRDDEQVLGQEAWLIDWVDCVAPGSGLRPRWHAYVMLYL